VSAGSEEDGDGVEGSVFGVKVDVGLAGNGVAQALAFGDALAGGGDGRGHEVIVGRLPLGALWPDQSPQKQLETIHEPHLSPGVSRRPGGQAPLPVRGHLFFATWRTSGLASIEARRKLSPAPRS